MELKEHVKWMCQLAKSDEEIDQRTAAAEFLELASKGDSYCELLYQVGLDSLCTLLKSPSRDAKHNSIQTIAYLAGDHKRHDNIVKCGIFDLLLSSLEPESHSSILEATIGALARMANKKLSLPIISKFMPHIVDILKVPTGLLQCNATALLVILAQQVDIVEILLSYDILQPLFDLRDKGDSRDLKQNATIALGVLGYTDKDPSLEYQKQVEELTSRGFSRGQADLAIRHFNREWNLQKALEWILDNCSDMKQLQEDTKKWQNLEGSSVIEEKEKKKKPTEIVAEDFETKTEKQHEKQNEKPNSQPKIDALAASTVTFFRKVVGPGVFDRISLGKMDHEKNNDNNGSKPTLKTGDTNNSGSKPTQLQLVKKESLKRDSGAGSTSSKEQKTSLKEQKISPKEKKRKNQMKLHLNQLTSMGYSPELARKALLNCDTLNAAIEWLLLQPSEENHGPRTSNELGSNFSRSSSMPSPIFKIATIVPVSLSNSPRTIVPSSPSPAIPILSLTESSKSSTSTSSSTTMTSSSVPSATVLLTDRKSDPTPPLPKKLRNKKSKSSQLSKEIELTEPLPWKESPTKSILTTELIEEFFPPNEEESERKPTFPPSSSGASSSSSVINNQSSPKSPKSPKSPTSLKSFVPHPGYDQQPPLSSLNENNTDPTSTEVIGKKLSPTSSQTNSLQTSPITKTKSPTKTMIPLDHLVSSQDPDLEELVDTKNILGKRDSNSGKSQSPTRKEGGILKTSKKETNDGSNNSNNTSPNTAVVRIGKLRSRKNSNNTYPKRGIKHRSPIRQSRPSSRRNSGGFIDNNPIKKRKSTKRRLYVRTSNSDLTNSRIEISSSDDSSETSEGGHPDSDDHHEEDDDEEHGYPVIGIVHHSNRSPHSRSPERGGHHRGGSGERMNRKRRNLRSQSDPRLDESNSSSSSNPEHSSAEGGGEKMSTKKWKEEITEWLKTNHLTKYTPGFIKQEIHVGTLPDLDERDLEDLGVRTVGARKLVMKAISNHFNLSPIISSPSGTSLSPQSDTASAPIPIPTAASPRLTSSKSAHSTSSSHSKQYPSSTTLPIPITTSISQTTPLPNSNPQHRRSTSLPSKLNPLDNLPLEGITNSSSLSPTSVPASLGGGGATTSSSSSSSSSSARLSSTSIDLPSSSPSFNTFNSLFPSPDSYSTEPTFNISSFLLSASSTLPPQPKTQTRQYSSSSKKIDLAFLQADPLTVDTPGRPRKLDLQMEKKILQDSLSECKRQFRVRFGVATKDNLLKMTTLGSRLLHISGHGDPNSLVLEDGQGGLNRLSTDTLRDLLVTGGNELQFVFISACFSSQSAKAFVDAGVPHVIAVQASTQVTDTSARAYARHVYLALCQGYTVAEAFKKGQAGVIAASEYSPPCCCAHLHDHDKCVTCPTCRTPTCCRVHVQSCHLAMPCCHPHLPHDDSLKFLLLPSDGKHDVRLLEDVPEGDWIDCTPSGPENNLPALPEHFLGRTKDEKELVRTVLHCRLCTIIGVQGVGKSALAKAVSRFVNERGHFKDGAFLLPLGSTKSTVDITNALANALKIDSHYNTLSDPSEDTLQKVFKRLRNSHMLFIWDDCDQFFEDAVTERSFRKYLQAFLDHNGKCSVLITAVKSVRDSIPGITHRVYNLSPLHLHDTAMLFYQRLPRELLSDDLVGCEKFLSNYETFSRHPLFIKLLGNPRLIEACAQLLNHMKLTEVDFCLDARMNDWPRLSQQAKTSLLKTRALRDSLLSPVSEPSPISPSSFSYTSSSSSSSSSYQSSSSSSSSSYQSPSSHQSAYQSASSYQSSSSSSYQSSLPSASSPSSPPSASTSPNTKRNFRPFTSSSRRLSSSPPTPPSNIPSLTTSTSTNQYSPTSSSSSSTSMNPISRHRTMPFSNLWSRKSIPPLKPNATIITTATLTIVGRKSTPTLSRKPSPSSEGGSGGTGGTGVIVGDLLSGSPLGSEYDYCGVSEDEEIFLFP